MKKEGQKIRTLRQISDKYDIKMSRLYKAIHFKQIPYYKPNGGKVYLDEDEILSWLTSTRIPSSKEVESQSLIAV